MLKWYSPKNGYSLTLHPPNSKPLGHQSPIPWWFFCVASGWARKSPLPEGDSYDSMVTHMTHFQIGFHIKRSTDLIHLPKTLRFFFLRSRNPLLRCRAVVVRRPVHGFEVLPRCSWSISNIVIQMYLCTCVCVCVWNDACENIIC